jgi:hypothetical protein
MSDLTHTLATQTPQDAARAVWLFPLFHVVFLATGILFFLDFKGIATALVGYYHKRYLPTGAATVRTVRYLGAGIAVFAALLLALDVISDLN